MNITPGDKVVLYATTGNKTYYNKCINDSFIIIGKPTVNYIQKAYLAKSCRTGEVFEIFEREIKARVL